MANDQVLTAEQVIDRTSKYLNDADVEFIKKAYEYAQTCSSQSISEIGRAIYYPSDSSSRHSC